MRKADLMKYKGYLGSIHFDANDLIFFGKIEFIRDLINYEAHDARSLVKAFQTAVNDYLKDCKLEGKEPNQPFKGSFNIRIEPELHREVYLKAFARGDTLNNLVRQALYDYLKEDHKYERSSLVK